MRSMPTFHLHDCGRWPSKALFQPIINIPKPQPVQHVSLDVPHANNCASKQLKTGQPHNQSQNQENVCQLIYFIHQHPASLPISQASSPRSGTNVQVYLWTNFLAFATYICKNLPMLSKMHSNKMTLPSKPTMLTMAYSDKTSGLMNVYLNINNTHSLTSMHIIIMEK